MAREVEIKLELSPAALERLEASGWLKRQNEVRREQLRSVYFDTPTRALRSEGVSLRVRHIGSKRLQGLKSADSQRALTREESEQEIAGYAPDLELAQGTELGAVLTNEVQDHLRPVFETQVERTVVPLHREDSEIELAIDRGEIRAGKRYEPISEIEIELKSGRLADLVQLAKRLGDQYELRYGPRSKAERGYALADGKRDAAVRAEEVRLKRDIGAAEGLQLIGLACLHHHAANRPALERGDSEGVHQSRVALRRLRAALSLFGDLLIDDESKRIKQGLRWLTSQLGPARDWDVFMEETLIPLRQGGQYESELSELELAVRRRRDDRLAEGQRAVAGDRARKVVLETALWLVGGDWLRAPDLEPQRRQQLKLMAQMTLSERNQKLTKKLRRFERLDPHQRHKLRIAVKKLHYGTEFFAALFTKRRGRRERYLDLLKELQDHLGQLNDIHAHELMLRDLLDAAAGHQATPAAAFAMGLVRGTEQRRALPLEAGARKTGKKLARAAAFWT
jgi:inorganic triphosphatase YgiF